MKKNPDLLSLLRSKKMRVTPVRRFLLQFFLDNRNRQIPLSELQAGLESKLKGIDRTSLYRNLETLKRLEIIQALNIPGKGKKFQYIFDRKVHHFYICKSCGRAKKGDEQLFKKIESALEDIHDFHKANLSVVFYGICSKCRT